jgi:hypothetical protein
MVRCLYYPDDYLSWQEVSPWEIFDDRHRPEQDHLSPDWPRPRGEFVLRKKLSRKQLLIYTATRTPMLIGMEACAGAH